MKKLVVIFLICIGLGSCRLVKHNAHQFDKQHYSFKTDCIYTTSLNNNQQVLFYFNSNDNLVYTDTITKEKLASLNSNEIKSISTFIYGGYEIMDNVIKIQKEFSQTKFIRTNRLQSILFLFLPIPSHPTYISVPSTYKEIITEGQIKKDTILFSKIYEGTRKFKYKKKIFAKRLPISQILLNNRKLEAIQVFNDSFGTYSISIKRKDTVTP